MADRLNSAGIAAGSSLFPDESFGQILSWQIGTGCAITANVVMGVWLARKGADLAAAGMTATFARRQEKQ